MNENWYKSHNGLFHCPLIKAIRLMPEIESVFITIPKTQYYLHRYIVDVKVHMLMPGQYACIPNWHYDMVPRVNGKQDFKQIKGDMMYLWVSGAPLPEFKKFKIKEQTWKDFTQRDEHRGTVTKNHTWRCFIRLCPDTIIKAAPEDKWLRRHSQVYLDVNNFTW